ncbi:MAG: hypothetical protein R2856_27625 [Caldilineaceae bacterium]
MFEIRLAHWVGQQRAAIAIQQDDTSRYIVDDLLQLLRLNASLQEQLIRLEVQSILLNGDGDL